MQARSEREPPLLALRDTIFSSSSRKIVSGISEDMLRSRKMLMEISSV